MPKGFMPYRYHLISAILSLIESYLALSYLLPSLSLLYYKIT